MLPRVRLTVSFAAKFVPSISTVTLPPLPPEVGPMAETVTAVVCAAVRVKPAVAATPEIL